MEKWEEDAYDRSYYGSLMADKKLNAVPRLVNIKPKVQKTFSDLDLLVYKKKLFKLQKCYNDILKPYNLTHDSFLILGIMVHKEGISRNKIMPEINIGNRTLKKGYDRLLKCGAIQEKEYKLGDKTAKYAITALGKTLYHELMEKALILERDKYD